MILSPKERAERNQDPHKSARMAMYLYSRQYATQGGGSMDFWDKLNEHEKRLCRECVKHIEEAPEEPEL